jgi:hypothetical protein
MGGARRTLLVPVRAGVAAVLLGRGREDGDLLEVGGAPGGEPAGRAVGEAAPSRREVEQAVAPGRPGERFAQIGGDVGKGPAFGDQAAQGIGLVEEVQALAEEVVGEGEAARLVVVEGANDRGDLGQAGRDGAAQAAGAEDELVAASGDRPDQEALLDALAGDAGGEAQVVLGVWRWLGRAARTPGIGIDGGCGEQDAGAGAVGPKRRDRR